MPSGYPAVGSHWALEYSASSLRSERAARPDLSVPPDLPRDVDDQAQLRPLLLFADLVAFDRAGEAALRAQTHVLQRHELRRLLDARHEAFAGFQRAHFRRHQSQDNCLVLRHETKRPEITGPPVVVLH